MSKSLSSPTAADVRAMFRTNAARYNKLPEVAQVSVSNGARGRIHPLAVKEFNRGRKPGRRYVVGATKEATAARAAARAKAAEAGVHVGKRGRLSKEALAVLKG